MNVGHLLDLCLPDLCELCDLQLPPGVRLLCRYCRDTLPRAPVTHEPLSRDPNIPDLLLTPLAYEDSARLLVSLMKFHHNQRAARILALPLIELVGHLYGTAGALPVLIPVPMSWRARVTRGFNQSEWLAAALCRRLPCHYRTRIVSKRHTPSQRTRSRSQRLALKAKTFTVRANFMPHHIAIIDDVYTTGATVRALRSRLRNAGAQRVDIWCATRT